MLGATCTYAAKCNHVTPWTLKKSCQICFNNVPRPHVVLPIWPSQHYKWGMHQDNSPHPNYNSAGTLQNHTQTDTQTRHTAQFWCSCSVITLSEKVAQTLTELKYWIFLGSRRPGWACSILPEEDIPLKETSQEKHLLLIAPRSRRLAPAQSGHIPQIPCSCGRVFTNAYTHTPLKIHISPSSFYQHPPHPPFSRKQMQFTWVEGRWQVAISLGNRVRGWRLVAY